MGRLYGEDQNNFRSDPPRPLDEPILKSDDTGNAARDGYKVLKRRPWGAPSGQIVAVEEADMREELSQGPGAIGTSSFDTTDF